MSTKLQITSWHHVWGRTFMVCWGNAQVLQPCTFINQNSLFLNSFSVPCDVNIKCFITSPTSILSNQIAVPSGCALVIGLAEVVCFWKSGADWLCVWGRVCLNRGAGVRSVWIRGQKIRSDRWHSDTRWVPENVYLLVYSAGILKTAWTRWPETVVFLMGSYYQANSTISCLS